MLCQALFEPIEAEAMMPYPIRDNSAHKTAPSAHLGKKGFQWATLLGFHLADTSPFNWPIWLQLHIADWRNNSRSPH